MVSTTRTVSRAWWCALCLPALAAGVRAQDTGGLLEGSWQEGAGRWLHLLGDVGPWVLAVLVVYVVARAVARGRRYRVADVLAGHRRDEVRAAIREAERRTVGEIVPVVVARSDPHPACAWRAGVAAAAAGSVLLLRQLPWDHPALLLLAQAALGTAGFLLARALPDLARLFLFETRASAVAEEQAAQEFFRHGLFRTEGRTGVLLFVSLFERRVVVLADEGIATRVDESVWEQVDDLVLDGIVAGDLPGGLRAALQRCGEILAEHAPLTTGDRNELPDRLIIVE